MLKELFILLNETINKSTIINFREFLGLHEEVTKWTIYSDYCIDDAGKLYNSATFTIIPYIDDYEDLRGFLKKLAPNDLKKSREISGKLCDFIKSGYMFNYSILFHKNKGHIFYNYPKEEYLNSLDTLNEMLQKWIKNTPSQKDYYTKLIKNNNRLKQELSRKTFNYKLFNNILLIQFISAYICFLISKEAKTKPEIIGWLSDRDNMTSGHNGIIYDLFHINYHVLCNEFEVDDSGITLIYTKTDLDSDTVWFDEMLRIPDYLTGAISGRNHHSNEPDKYDFLFENAIADNDYLALLNIYNEENGKGVNRVSVTKKAKESVATIS
ncbi:hypothetical protein H0178_31275 [Cytobacillus firmus]|nr:hypothetical protein [Cytobacillus firmus]